MFDNRTFLNKAGLSAVQGRIDRARGLGRNHFMLEVGGKRLGYCYVRKNACSSFKKMFVDLAPAAYPRIPDERPIDFMMRHHLMHDTDFARCDHLVFVYRDPVQRILSLFRNKFIVRNGAVDIHRNFEKVEQKSAEKSTFRYFIETYLSRDFDLIDRHVLPQSVHLRRAVYDVVIPVHKLHDSMSQILGSEIGDRYFQRPVNQTSDIALLPVPGAADTLIKDLHETYVRNGYMPDDESLLTPELRDVLVARYGDDLAIISRFQNGGLS